MTSTIERTRIVTQSGNSIFQVPDRVAYEEGFFDAHGLDVIPSEGEWKDPRTWKGFSTPLPRNPAFDPLARFEAKTQDTWNMCEWGAIYRAEQAERPGRIGYLRPAVVAQVIVSFRDDIQEPHDLAGRAVGVGNLYFGNHYNTLELLEGPLRRDQIVIDHDPDHLARAQSGDLAAVTVMEPFVRQLLNAAGMSSPPSSTEVLRSLLTTSRSTPSKRTWVR